MTHNMSKTKASTTHPADGEKSIISMLHDTNQNTVSTTRQTLLSNETIPTEEARNIEHKVRFCGCCWCSMYDSLHASSIHAPNCCALSRLAKCLIQITNKKINTTQPRTVHPNASNIASLASSFDTTWLSMFLDGTHSDISS
jgi:hypothetical protein